MKTNFSLLAAAAALALGAALPVAAHDHHQHEHQEHHHDNDHQNHQWLQRMTVAAAKKLPADSKVMLEGVLVKKISSERYLFRDTTGSIEVEIDDDDWRGRTPQNGLKLRLVGKVDHHRLKPIDIDVSHIEFR